MKGGKCVENLSEAIWKRSMLQSLSYDKIIDCLEEMSDNGDAYGYERTADWYPDEQGYYQEYKEQFNELAFGASALWEALSYSDISEHWDDMTVALLGETHKVLGYDAVEADYYGMLCCEEGWAVMEAEKRLERLSKAQLIKGFRLVLTTLVSYADIKAAHDCLTSIVEELDERSALLSRKNDEINRLYSDLTGANGAEFDRIIDSIPQRMWVE